MTGTDTATDTATDARKTPWFPIDNIVVDAFNLTPNEGWLYTVIVRFANRKTGDAFPSQAKLAKVANMSKSSVIRCIAALEKKNLIRVERDMVQGKKQKAVNHYVVLDPHEAAKGSVTQTPRSFPQTLRVVSEVDSNNNQLINTKEQERELRPAAENKQAPPADTPPLSSESLPPEQEPVNLDLIGAWLESLPTRPRDRAYSTTNLRYQEALLDDGIIAADVREFVAEKHDPTRGDDFWLDKVMPFEHVYRFIEAWKRGRIAKAAAASPPPRPPVHIPPGVPGCSECEGRGMWAGPDGKSIPCPACLAAEQAAQEVRDEQSA